MLKRLLFIFILSASSAWADQPAADCSVEQKSWDTLVQEFIAGWKSADGEFCQFKRFTALNSLISEDMREDEIQYETRISSLEAYGDRLEPINYLLAAFQETWFNLFIDASLEREYGRAKLRWNATGATAGSLAALTVALPFTKSYSSKAIGFLRGFVSNWMQKRAVVFGLTASLKGGSKIVFGKRPHLKTEFVRPPLLSETGEKIDTRVQDIFVNEFWDEIIGAGAGVAGGWALGHYSSLGVKAVAPKWSGLVDRAWARGKIADFASPGMIVGTAITLVATDRITNQITRAGFLNKVNAAKMGLAELAHKTTAAVAAGNEREIWLNGEKIKNGLLLQNYLLTREFTQYANQYQEWAMTRILNRFVDCSLLRSKILDEEHEAFRVRLGKLVDSSALNLQAALDITQTAQENLIANPHPMTDGLIDTVQNFMRRDQLLLNKEALTQVLWEDIVAGTKDAIVECGLPEWEAFP